MTLEWVCNERSAPVTFEFQFRMVHDFGWPNKTQSVQSFACRKRNLEPNTAYQFRVRSVFANGNSSAFSTPITVCTKGFSPKKKKKSARDAGSEDVPPQAPQPPEPKVPKQPPRPPSSSETVPPMPTPRDYSVPPNARDKDKRAEAHAKHSKPAAASSGWSCAICSRSNTAHLKNCRVCGAARNYDNDRLNNITESRDAADARKKAAKQFEEYYQKRDAEAQRQQQQQGGSTDLSGPL